MSLSPERQRINNAKMAHLPLTSENAGDASIDLLLNEDAQAMQGGLPDGEVPSAIVFGLTYMAKTDMRVEFGDPSMAGTDWPLSPDTRPGGLEAAYYAQEAAKIVEQRIGDVYATWQHALTASVTNFVRNLQLPQECLDIAPASRVPFHEGMTK